MHVDYIHRLEISDKTRDSKKRTPASVRVTYIFMNELDLSRINHAESFRVFRRIGVAAFHFPKW